MNMTIMVTYKDCLKNFFEYYGIVGYVPFAFGWLHGTIVSFISGGRYISVYESTYDNGEKIKHISAYDVGFLKGTR